MPEALRRRRVRAVNRGVRAVHRSIDAVERRQARDRAARALIYEAGGDPPPDEPVDTDAMLEAREYADRVLDAAERIYYPDGVSVEQLEDDVDLVEDAVTELEA